MRLLGADKLFADVIAYAPRIRCSIALFDATACLLYVVHADSSPARKWLTDVGACYSEDACGLIAHTKALRTGEDAVVVGVEHHLDIFASTISVALPLKSTFNDELLVVAFFLETALPNDDAASLALMLLSEIRSGMLALRESSRYKNIAESSMDLLSLSLPFVDGGVLVLNGAFRVMNANSEAGSLLSRPREQLLGMNFLDYLGSDAYLRGLLVAGKTVQNRPFYVDCEDGRRTLTINARLLRGRGADAASYFICITSREQESLEGILLAPHSPVRRLTFDTLIGTDAVFLSAKNQALFFSPTHAPVLLRGEVSTGKKHFASAIHEASGVRGDLVRANCNSIGDENGMRMLFGRESMKGEVVEGLVKQADGGTLLLEEIDLLPAKLQTLLANASYDHEFRRDNGLELVYSDFRLIATTTKPLGELIDDRVFSSELYYRLGTCIIELPPLRMRKGDILQLIAEEARFFCMRHKLPYPVNLSNGVKKFLVQYQWPGNIQQLKSVVHHFCDRCVNRSVQLSDLPANLLPQGDNVPERKALSEPVSLAEVECQRIKQALGLADGNITEAAKSLGISRTTLYNKLKRYNIDSEQYR